MENNMQNIMKRIIDMDKRARELTADAKAKKAGSAAAIEEKINETRHNFLDMAQRRVDVIEQSEIEEANEQIETIGQKAREAGMMLEKKYEENHARWAEELVNRVITGDDLG